jgi:ribosomal protein S18 acetylase RimI-like enzyme/glycosyltransferase involved in cell wall biosynthesis
MATEIRSLEPWRRHFVVVRAGGPFVPPVMAQAIEFARSPWPWAAFKLWRRLRRYRIGLAPVLFDGTDSFRGLRWAAAVLAPRRILAYNARLERFHLRLSAPIASLLFLAGVPLDRIFLRPRWLWPWKRDRSVVPPDGREWTGRTPEASRARVAILTPYFPYPLSHGGAVRIYSLLREIARTFDVYLLSFYETDPEEAVAALLPYCARVTAVPKPRYREPRWSTLLPPEVHEFRSPAMREALARARQRDRVQVLQTEYTFLAPYGGDILVEHDVTFDLYRQIYERNHTLSSWWDWFRWRRFEKRAVRGFRRVVVMSDKDRELLGIPHTCVIPNGVDLARFSPAGEPDAERMLFIGSFRHFPNIVAFRFFFEDVWPELRRRFPKAELTVVAGPDALLYWREHTGLAALPSSDRMRLFEFVADVRPFYEETNLVLVPTLVSAGTNVKLIEALAMCRAALSTSSGCAGLGLAHGETVWIADGAEAFLEAATALLSGPALRRSIAQKGYEAAHRRFGWNRIGEIQRSLLRQLAGEEFLIRPVRIEDLPELSAIQATALEAAQWRSEDYLRFDCHVAECGGRIAGFLVSRPIVPGEREILNVAVHPGFRRRGAGSLLIRAEIERWPGNHFLEVRESNTAARNLYKKLGFQDVGVRPGYYESPPEAGIVMRFFS